MTRTRYGQPATAASPADIIHVGDTPEAWARVASGISPTVRVFSRADAMLRAEEESRREQRQLLAAGN